MNVFYEALGLSKFKMLNYKLPYEKIVSNCKSDRKREEFMEILGNVISLDIVFSLKELPIIYEKEILERVEVQVIEIKLDKSNDFKPVIDVIEACIPYDAVLVFKSNEKYLAHFISKTIVYDNDSFIHIDTDWLYEEEIERLLSDCSLDYAICEIKEFEDIFRNMSTLRDFAESTDEVCLRRYVDMLILRERKWHNAYIKKALSMLQDEDEIILIGDSPFVYWSKMVSYFDYLDDSPWNRVLIDGRYGANHRYIADGLSREQMDCLWSEVLYEGESVPWEDEEFNHENYYCYSDEE